MMLSQRGWHTAASVRSDAADLALRSIKVERPPSAQNEMLERR